LEVVIACEEHELVVALDGALRTRRSALITLVASDVNVDWW